MPSSKIAPPGRGVKRPSAAFQKDTGDGYPRRPDVLRKMPLSCSVVFDVLRSLAMGEAVTISVSELSVMCRLSHRQVRRILTRLHGAHLIYWHRGGPGRCHPSTIEILWKSPAQMARSRLRREGDISTPLTSSGKAKTGVSLGAGSFPQKKGAPQQCRPEADFRLRSPYTQRFKSFSHMDSRPQLSARAHRWAMAQLRRAVRACPIPWPRRNAILEALGQALWRVTAQQKVGGPRDLARLVQRLRAALLWEELPQERQALHAWAGWAVREILQDLRREDRALAASEELVARIRQEREEARRAWSDSRGFAWREVVTNVPREEGWWGIVLARTVLAGEQTY